MHENKKIYTEGKTTIESVIKFFQAEMIFLIWEPTYVYVIVIYNNNDYYIL